MVIRIIRFSLLSALLMSLSIKSISEEQARLSLRSTEPQCY